MGKQPILTKKKHPVEYERALDVAEGYLAGVARARQVTTYVEVSDIVASVIGLRVMGNFYATLLGDVSRRTWSNHRVMLSAVVVNGDRLKPGGGFVGLARYLGAGSKHQTDDEIAADQLAKVWRKYSR